MRYTPYLLVVAVGLGLYFLSKRSAASAPAASEKDGTAPVKKTAQALQIEASKGWTFTGRYQVMSATRWSYEVHKFGTDGGRTTWEDGPAGLIG